MISWGIYQWSDFVQRTTGTKVGGKWWSRNTFYILMVFCSDGRSFIDASLLTPSSHRGFNTEMICLTGKIGSNKVSSLEFLPFTFRNYYVFTECTLSTAQSFCPHNEQNFTGRCVCSSGTPLIQWVTHNAYK